MCFVEKVLKDVLVTLEGCVSKDSVYCCLDSEVALYWVKGKESVGSNGWKIG